MFLHAYIVSDSSIGLICMHIVFDSYAKRVKRQRYSAALSTVIRSSFLDTMLLERNPDFGERADFKAGIGGHKMSRRMFCYG